MIFSARVIASGTTAGRPPAAPSLKAFALPGSMRQSRAPACSPRPWNEGQFTIFAFCSPQQKASVNTYTGPSPSIEIIHTEPAEGGLTTGTAELQCKPDLPCRIRAANNSKGRICRLGVRHSEFVRFRKLKNSVRNDSRISSCIWNVLLVAKSHRSNPGARNSLGPKSPTGAFAGGNVKA